MRKMLINVLICTLMACMLAGTAIAAYIPENEVCENRDGRQLIIRTYTLAPGDDPTSLNEGRFEREGFSYSCVSIVKEEKPFERREQHNETVTVETRSNDLAAILGELGATMLYDCGEYSAILTLDHTSLHTEATGYSTRSYTITDTKTIEGLDLNDPSYIPRTTVKNGVTLDLQNIDWSVQSTALSDDVLVPSQYMATATYSANSSYRAANGYITTATYTGEIVTRGIESVIYTVTYVGAPIQPPEPETVPEPQPEPEPEPEPTQEPEPAPAKIPFVKYIICACAILGLLSTLVTAVTCLVILRNGAKYIGQTVRANKTKRLPDEEEIMV